MTHADFGERERDRVDLHDQTISLAKLPTRIRQALLAIGSIACERRADDIISGAVDIGASADWVPVALVATATPRSGRRCFSLFCGSNHNQRVMVEVETAVALLNRGLLCSIPGDLNNLTLSTHAVELLRRGTVTVRQVRNVKAAWDYQNMDRRWAHPMSGHTSCSAALLMPKPTG